MRRFVAALPHDVLRCVALIPLSVAEIAVGARPWQRLDRRRVTASAATVRGHGLAGLVLGLVALVPLGVLALSVLRGLFYGLVDRGPYDNAWGGPSLAGAWLAHLVISVPLVIAGLLALAGVAAVHRRVSRPLYGDRVPAWAVLITVLATVLAALLVTGWLRQI